MAQAEFLLTIRRRIAALLEREALLYEGCPGEVAAEALQARTSNATLRAR